MFNDTHQPEQRAGEEILSPEQRRRNRRYRTFRKWTARANDFNPLLGSLAIAAICYVLYLLTKPYVVSLVAMGDALRCIHANTAAVVSAPTPTVFGIIPSMSEACANNTNLVGFIADFALGTLAFSGAIWLIRPLVANWLYEKYTNHNHTTWVAPVGWIYDGLSAVDWASYLVSRLSTLVVAVMLGMATILVMLY